jgi:hypothetical protein
MKQGGKEMDSFSPYTCPLGAKPGGLELNSNSLWELAKYAESRVDGVRFTTVTSSLLSMIIQLLDSEGPLQLSIENWDGTGNNEQVWVTIGNPIKCKLYNLRLSSLFMALDNSNFI